MATEPQTLIALLQWRAAGQPAAIGYTFLRDGEEEEEHLTYAALDRRAREIAARLQRCSQPGDRALLLFPPGLDYISAFFGCLYAGVIAVPAYPPRAGRPWSAQTRVLGIAEDAQPSVVLTDAALLRRHVEGPDAVTGVLARAAWLDGAASGTTTGTSTLATPTAGALSTVAPAAAGVAAAASAVATAATVSAAPTATAVADVADDWTPPSVQADDVAFLQYTSGSTAAPKGVVLTHANLLANQRMIQAACHHTADSTFVGWLPLYHDMGLIGNVLQPLFIGARAILLSPAAVLQRPARWLSAISRYRACTSGGPNFAYELCADRITPEARAALDLRSWRIAFNGAEPVHAETLARFTEAFAPSGFRAASFFPCYGLAEASLIVTGRAAEQPPRVRELSTEALARHVAAPAGDEPARRLVSCGPPVIETRVAIVRPDTRARCADGEVGEIWIAGPAVTSGYWRRPQVGDDGPHADLDGTRYFRTGDLGFLDAGELFVTGRARDLIVVRGRNHYAEDLEWTVHQALAAAAQSATQVAAISIERDRSEQVIVLIEDDPRARPPLAEVAAIARRAVAEEHDLSLFDVVRVARGALPRTSSGKLQRHACRERYLQDGLEVIDRSTQPAAATATATDAEMASMEAAPTVDRALPPGPARTAAFAQYLPAAAHAVLGYAVDMDDPLTAHGLDSLAALLLKNRIEEETGTPVDLEELVTTPSLRALAERLGTREGQADVAADLPIVSEDAPFPLTRGQQAVFLLHQLPQEQAAYHIARVVRLDPGVDAVRLEQAWQDVAQRHAALRLRLRVMEGAARQQVHAEAGPFFRVIDASDWDAARLETELAAAANAPFDLAHGPVFRVQIYLTAEARLMLMVVHHIVSDLWSVGLLLETLGACYDARTAAGPDGVAGSTQLPAPAATSGAEASYAQHVAWQEQMLRGPKGTALRDYWREALADTPPPAALLADWPRPATRRARGRRITWMADRELTPRLSDFCRESGVTPHALLLASLQVVLWRHGGPADSVVGSLAVGRDQRAFEHCAGYFANALPIRTRLAPPHRFRDVARATHRTVLEALAHQELPLSALVEAVRPARDAETRRSPLFDLLFVYQKVPARGAEGLTGLALNVPGARLRTGGLALEVAAFEPGICQFDLSVMAGMVDDRLALAIEFDTERYKQPRIARLAAQLLTLLASALAEPDARIDELSIVPDDERHQLTTVWNRALMMDAAGVADLTGAADGANGANGARLATDPTGRRDVTVDRLMRECAATAPDRVAVVSGDEHLSYSALEAAAGQLAAHLIAERGVRPESRVGLCGPRGLPWIVGVRAILEAGAAFVPIDPEYPAARAKTMCAQARVDTVLTTRTASSLFEPAQDDTTQNLVILDDWIGPAGPDAPAAPAASSSPRAAARNADTLAYVLFTSGSTGQPKGAMNTHRALVNRLRWMQARFDLQPGDRVLHKTPATFDVSVWEYLWPLITGATIVLAEPGGHRDPIYLADVMASAQIAVVHFVPSMLETWLPHAGALRGGSLRHIVCSGEALSSALAGRVVDTLGLAPHNLYGPTEAAIDVSAHTFDRAADDEAVTVPIGQPIDEVTLHVLDARLQLVPVGVHGELFIGGVAPARGYVEAPALTAERFLPDPCATRPGARMYRTGDRVQRLGTGSLEYLGRFDRQIKIRGQRVELQEIEAQLERCPLVERALAIVSRKGAGDDRIVVYAVIREDAPGVLAEVWLFLRERLPSYMLPAFIVRLDAMPLTAHGKLDTRALPPVDETRPEWVAMFAPPRDALDEAMAGFWARGLGLRQVGIHDNFFELGGHSLLATQIVWQVQELVPGSVPMLQAFFEIPTVAGLTDLVRGRAGEGDLDTVVQRLTDANVPVA